MPHDGSKPARLAVLIDAENISARYAPQLFKEIAGIGSATARRIYGDWSRPDLAGWRPMVDRHALSPVQQFQSTAGKNGADGALIIDAMDLLHSDRFDGFCIVSSDGDFAKLARRIRESGLLVFGFGECKAPGSFVNSCDRFFKLSPEDREPACNPAPPPPPPSPPPPEKKVGPVLVELARNACQATAGEDGWASLSAFGDQIRKLSPGFDPRSFGCKKLGDLITSVGLFEVKKVTNQVNPKASSWYIRAKGCRNG